jgi:putative heme-binding domain-containing protein
MPRATLYVLAALMLCLCREVVAEEPPVHALLVIGGCCHDYAHQQKILTEGISARANVKWTIVHEGDGSTTHKMSIYNDPDWSKEYDIVVHDECCADVKDKDFVEGILKPHRAGLPAVNLHCAMHCYRVDFDNFKDWFEFTGLDTRAHGAQEPIALSFVDPRHAITQGMENWTTIPEELYNNIRVCDTVTPLIYGRQGNDNNLVAWINNYHGTRVFSTTLGHNNETVADPRYLDLVTRGLLWAVNKLNADYLNPAAHVLAAPPRNAKKILTPINLALNMPATASGSQAGHDPSQAVDGDPDTRWCAPDNGNGYWWQVDLQRLEDLTGCRIYWEQENRPYQYIIAGSADGGSWKTLLEEFGDSGRPQNDERKFNAHGIRYVRVTVTAAPPGSWASFFEFAVHGKKLVEKNANEVSDWRLAEVKMPQGFQKTLFAAPPDISYPTCIAAPPGGPVFVGVDQNSSLDTQANRGWVVRCVDTNGDGVADQFNIFARMDSPRGLVFDHDTLYVMHPPVLEAFHDDNGAGTANRSEILVSGLGHDLRFRGADHTCNGVRMGIDGWLYIALGDYGAFKAVGKDGTVLQLHGGGIIRVRPDGSELELVVQGTRNIYDVAIDPLLNLFTCDNTNDGDDWNVRLSQMIPTAHYGYPSLFRHFSDEMIPTMADYGGGAPTGAIFLDEPSFPANYGHGLYACQWGWNSVTRHPLKRDGASFKAEKEPFIELPRPTGIDEDGQGNLYVASWKGAVFSYAGPNVGYIARISPMNKQSSAFPDLQKATDAKLLELLASPSPVWRLAVQREILRRGERPVFARDLEKIARTHENLAVGVAALSTLNQMLGARAHDPLLRLSKDGRLREYALKALADRKKDAANIPTSVFTDALADTNPAVRLQAVIALNRLGRSSADEAVVPLLADADPSVSHVAFRALISFRAIETCFKTIDESQTPLIPGALRVLRNLHEAAVVDGLIARLNSLEAPSSISRPILDALCRLYYREADWDGSWWGTRPDTSGPYYNRVTWDQSEKIGRALQDFVFKADDATLRFLLEKFELYKMNLPDLLSALIKAATQKPELRSMVVDLAAKAPQLSKEAISFLERAALDGNADADLRARAFGGLQHALSQQPALDAAIRALLTLRQTQGAENLSKTLWDGFVHDPRLGGSVAQIEKLTMSQQPAQSILAFSILLDISANKNASQPARDAALQAIQNAWKSSQVQCLIRAVGQQHFIEYVGLVRSYLSNARPDIAAAAAEALRQLAPIEAVAQNAVRNHTIAGLPYDEVVRETSDATGDAKLGAQLFEKLSCVKCHTTSKSEPLKGPFLGDIAARYKKPEIMESVLRPSAQIAQGFVTATFEMKDGSDYDGFIVRESGDEVEIRNLAGAIVLAKSDIVKRGTSKTSIMPEGLADQLTPQELASLLAYLQSLNPKS